MPKELIWNFFNMNKSIIYTVGYTLFQNRNGIDTAALFQTLKGLGVNFLVDVRSVPYSRQFPQCNSDFLKIEGRRYGVTYIHMPEVGAKASPTQDVFSPACDIFFEDIFPISKSNRPEKTELECNDEIVDFIKFRHDDYFIDGLKRIETAYDKGYTLALMCSEKNPMECHRYFLISKSLEERFGEWLSVQHIIRNTDGTLGTLSNEDLNKLLEKTIFAKQEIRRLDVLNKGIFEDHAKIDNYFGDTLEDKISDFCFRFWNLMHGWKKITDNNYQDINNYD